MTPELIAIIAVGIALGGLLLTVLQIVLKRIDQLEDRFDRLEGRVEDRFERLETRMANLEQRQTRLEGLLDGIREALFERASR